MPRARRVLLLIPGALAAGPAAAQAPAPATWEGKPGGILRLVLRDDLPQGFSNLTGLGVDDPDANFYENDACGSPWNYGDYCGWRPDRFARYPYVKNLVLNQVTYNCCRLQEVWLDP